MPNGTAIVFYVIWLYQKMSGVKQNIYSCSLTHTHIFCTKLRDASCIYLEKQLSFRWNITIYSIEWALDSIFSQVKILTSYVHEMKQISIIHKKKKLFYIFHASAIFKVISGPFKMNFPLSASNICHAMSAWEFVIFWRHQFDVVASKPMTRHFPLNG